MKKYIFTLLLQFIVVVGFSQIKAKLLRCENLINPIGLDIQQPQFSWQLISGKRNVMQVAYEIRVGSNAAFLLKGKNLHWSSGKIESDQSIHVVYEGDALQSAKKYFWQVRVWDNLGNISSWSEPGFWQMGLLKSSDWKAKWIQVGYEEDSVLRQSPVFRKEFSTNKKIDLGT